MAFSFVLFSTFGSTATCLVLLGFAVFLILLVLVQRGKGGGLSGAFGGMGGQSAFGTKAGDTFTRITVVTATLWIVICIISAKYLGVASSSRFAAAAGDVTPTSSIPAEPGAGPLGDDFLGGANGVAPTQLDPAAESDPAADTDGSADTQPPVGTDGN